MAVGRFEVDNARIRLAGARPVPDKTSERVIEDADLFDRVFPHPRSPWISAANGSCAIPTAGFPISDSVRLQCADEPMSGLVGGLICQWFSTGGRD